MQAYDQCPSSSTIFVITLGFPCSRHKWLRVNFLKFQQFSHSILNKRLVFRAGIHKMLVRTANREDPDQTASSEAVCSGSALSVEACLAGN